MAKAIRGGHLSEEVMTVLKHAWKYRPNRYTEVHAEEKGEVAAEVNSSLGEKSVPKGGRPSNQGGGR